MIRQSSSHSRGSFDPFGSNDATTIALLFRQRKPQAHVRSSKVVERLKENHSSSKLSSVFTKAQAFSHKWRQTVTHCEVESLNQICADRQTQFFKTFSSADDLVNDLFETPLFFLFYNLTINQIRMRFFDWFFGPSWLSRSGENLQNIIIFNQSGQITTEPIAEKA